MKTQHTKKEIKKLVNDLIGAKQIDVDLIDFEYIRSPAEAYKLIRDFFELGDNL